MEGKLDPKARQSLELHADQCSACHELLAAYARGYLMSNRSGTTSKLTDGKRVKDLQRAVGLSAGTHVGRYVIVDWVGEGASGVVYAAHDPELDRKVAIKVLHRSVEQRREKLLNEARAMAKLAHPNVVSVHDVGSVGDHVFVAMEFVDGCTLRTWAEQDARSTQEIIGAFLDAGRGLAAAHTAGLVHRDFKPENVLVGKDDRVRVTDFGLACPNDDETEWTNAMAGTPAYMAPEVLRGRAADARSDQFSFCVALGEALLGRRPATPRDVTNAKASRRLSDGKRVSKRLTAIVARGLEASPELRFESMSSLLRAIESAESRGRRWLAAAAVLGVLSLGVWAYVATAHGRLCTDAAAGLRGVWDDDAKRDASRAFQATGVANAGETWQSVSRTMDAYASSWTLSRTDACQATRVRGEQSDAVLTLRMQCLDRRRGELGALRDVFAHADGDVVQHAVDAASRLRPISACDDTTALASSIPLPESVETRSGVDKLRSDLDRVEALESAGKSAVALPDARKDVALAKALAYRPIEAEALYLQGRLEAQTGDYRASAATLYDAVNAAEAGRHDEIAAEVWVTLVEVLGAKLDRFADSDLAVQRAKAAVERLGASSEAARMLPDALGTVDQEAGRYAQAVKHHETAVALKTKALGAEHLQVARSLRKLGEALRDNGQMDAALSTYAKSLSIEEQQLGPNHPEVASTVQGIGVTLSRLGRYSEARERYERALTIRERVLGDNHPLVGETLSSLVVAMRWSGAAADALPLAERALAIEQASFGLYNDLTAGALNNVAFVHEALGHFAEARRSYEQALHIREKVFGPDNARVSISLTNLARTILEQDDPKGALVIYQRAVQVDEQTLKEGHADRAYALVGLGKTYLASGDATHALPVLERALALRESNHVSPRLLAEARFALARGLWIVGQDRKRALTLATQARDDYAPLGPAFEVDRRDVHAWLESHML